MFAPNSRYAAVPTVPATDLAGRPVVALKHRRLPARSGTPLELQDRDRLDLLAHAHLGDGTAFWQIADANTAADARRLTGELPAERRRRERDQLPASLVVPAPL